MGLVFCFFPGGPLYAIGNVRKSGYLTAFGFVRELPESFLQPADLIMRLFPGSNSADQARLNEITDKYGGILYIEYMPDKTYIHIARAPIHEYPMVSSDELARTFLTNCGHLLPYLPLRYCDAIDEPKCSKRTISGYEFECAEAPMAIDGGAMEKSKIKERDRYQALSAVRYFAGGSQRLTVIVITKGHTVNLEATEQLLDCLSLK